MNSILCAAVLFTLVDIRNVHSVSWVLYVHYIEMTIKFLVNEIRIGGFQSCQEIGISVD